jgi:anti-sigma factor RsiW
MTPVHLSDEAVAAFADGVLGGHARDRAARHTAECAECREAVQVQREAAYALRAAAAPPLPAGLFDRLREVPMTTPLTTLPTAVAPDGSTVLATFAPAAALVPGKSSPTGRARPYLTTAAVVALAGALAAGSVAADRGATLRHGTGHPSHHAGDFVPEIIPAAHVWRSYAP